MVSRDQVRNGNANKDWQKANDDSRTRIPLVGSALALAELLDNGGHHKQVRYSHSIGEGETSMMTHGRYGQAGGSPISNTRQASHLRGIAEAIRSGRARLEGNMGRFDEAMLTTNARSPDCDESQATRQNKLA